MENRIKEAQLWLFADRTSTTTMRANQLRLTFATFAGVLMTLLRRVGLPGTALARAQAGTIRTRLLKIGARITVSRRRIRIAFASVYPLKQLFAHVLAALRAPPASARRPTGHPSPPSNRAGEPPSATARAPAPRPAPRPSAQPTSNALGPHHLRRW